MKMSVIGGGNIGGTLGSKWAGAGHEVVFGVRDPEAAKVKTLLAEAGHGSKADTVSNAIHGAAVVLFAIPSRVMADSVSAMGSELDGKILIDATNDVGGSTMHQLDLLGEAAPNSPLFRAFSNLGWENFAEPVIDGMQVDLFYCGHEGEGQQVVDGLIADIGLRPVYLGGLEQAGLVDALTRIWFVLAMGQGRGRHLALKMIGG